MLDCDNFTHNGREFRVEFPRDDDHGAPWDEEDGHGPVSEWTTRPKLPGERIIAEDTNGYCGSTRSRRFYDVQEAMKIARRDGWDAKPYQTGTKGEQAARAVEADFEWLRKWCNDQWHYLGVIVTARCDRCGKFCGPSESIWGIESESEEYLDETARELADEIQPDPVDGEG